MYRLVPVSLPDVCKAELSDGDFVPCSKTKRITAKRPGEEEDGDNEEEGEREDDDEKEDTSALFSCPFDGCICTYQRYYNLEYHLLFGKCKLVSERHTLLDHAMLAYAAKVEEGSTIQPTLAASASTKEPETPLMQGWALKGMKKATRFSESQRQYLDAKFQIGQESGHKADPEEVSREMRYARKENGGRLFKVEEFLTPQQIQGYFSRAAAKLKNATVTQSAPEVLADASNDFQAAEEEEAYSSARTSVLDQCQLTHPIVYDTLNVCSLYHANKLSKLTVAQLWAICSYYNMEAQLSRRKAPYLNFISDLVGSCSCSKV